MREKRPEYVERNCVRCGKLFQAHKLSIGYAENCYECRLKKGWLPSKARDGKLK